MLTQSHSFMPPFAKAELTQSPQPPVPLKSAAYESGSEVASCTPHAQQPRSASAGGCSGPQTLKLSYGWTVRRKVTLAKTRSPLGLRGGQDLRVVTGGVEPAGDPPYSLNVAP